MNKLLLAGVLLLSGCASTQQPTPMSVLVMPNDCANKAAIESWIQRNIDQETNNDRLNALKHKIWTLRYVCNR